MTYLSLDVSKKRIGLAKSLSPKSVVVPLKTYQRSLLHEDLKFISEYIKDEDIKIVILGLPLNMDESEGLAAQKMRQFYENLKDYLSKKNFSGELILWDERLTTFEALDQATGKKCDIDALAAKVILEDYFSSLER